MIIERIHFTQIDSTNTWAKTHADTLDPTKLHLIVADEQTAGRGRFNRSWISPPGENIYATFCFFRKKLWEGVSHVPQVLALSAIEALNEFNFYPRIKWPNDLLLSEKKIAGILAETTTCRHGVAIVVGIGINVNMPKGTCDAIDRPATSLLVEGDAKLDPSIILDRLEHAFGGNLNKLHRHGFSSFLSRFRQFATPPNLTICFSDGRKVWKGEQMGITEEGALRLKTESGEIKVFHAGEILFT
jgi:BirA family biotin operon repressor/biotin-[acetyl-CoA-carboxylase] ligase